MKIKRIKTKKEKMLIKLDIAVLLICLAIYVSKDLLTGMPLFLDTIIEWVQVLFAVKANLPIILIVSSLLVWLFVFNIISDCFWLIIVYLAYRITRKKEIKKNTQYEVIDNIEYYREVFNNLSPTEISLIADLEVEHKKDLTASIVRLYQKGTINFEEKSIIVKNTNNLKESDLKLIDMIQKNDFNGHALKEWEQKSVEEALTNNYIKIKDPTKTKKSFFTSGKVMLIAFILLVGSLFMLANNSSELLENLTKVENEYSNYVSQYYPKGVPDNFSDSEVLELFSHEPKFVELFKELMNVCTVPLYLIIVITLSFAVLVACPFYMIIKKVIHHPYKSSNLYERTKNGKILVEQIAGMKKYIHDFSLLSEKDKEHVKLWEDFLIYAIVLEENESIINDIFTYQNINFSIFNSINELF